MNSKEYPAKFIKLLVREYLTEEYADFESLGEKHQISKQMVRQLMWRGIAECILSDRIADLVFLKTTAPHRKGYAARVRRWEKAFDERREFRYQQRKLKEQEAQSTQVNP